MLRYLLRRFCYSLIVLWGVATLVFLLFKVIPANRSRLTPGQRTGGVAEKGGTPDMPGWAGYWLYLNDLAPVGVTYIPKSAKSAPGLHLTQLGDSSYLSIKAPSVGCSFYIRHSVSSLLGAALPGTLILLLSAMLMAIVFGVMLGVLTAWKKGTVWDSGAIAASAAGISIPAFFAALIIACISGHLVTSHAGLSIAGSHHEHYTFSGWSPALRNLILPAIALSIRPMAIVTQLMRSAMPDALRRDYIRAAYATGLSRSRIMLRHALPNALGPLLKTTPGWLAELIAGSFFIEIIFGRSGIGRPAVEALDRSDFPLIMSAILLMAVFWVAVRLLADVLAALIDPRLRL